MPAIVASPAAGPDAAQPEFRLTAATQHIVQPDRAIAHTKRSTAVCCTPSMTKLSAYDCGIQVIKFIIANCSPLSIIENLHAALIESITTHKPHYSQ